MKTSLLAQKYGKENRWVNYKAVEKEGRMTKIPFQVSGALMDSTNPSHWSTFEEAYQKDSNRVGMVFPLDMLTLGIDIDDCLNPETKGIEHELKQVIATLILEADTYTEISPSGNGLHFIFELTAPLPLIAHKNKPFETYSSERYFTVTGNSYGEEREVRTITPEIALELLAIIGYPWGKEERPIELLTQEHGNAMDDTTILEKMFSSKKNGIEIKALYEGDTSKYKGDTSSADMALLSHLAFWTQKNPEQMERLWTSSPLGKREKTEKRKDYRDRSILNAIKNTTVVYQTKAMRLEEEYPELDLLFTVNSKKDKVFTLCTENIIRILDNHPDFKGRFRFDIFKNKIELQKKGVWKEIEDNDMVLVQTDISKKLEIFQKVSKIMVSDAILMVCKENTIDSAAQYVKSLVWDQMPRLDTWLTNVYGTPDDIYHRMVGSNWLKGLVNRIINPGCKFDYVLVLEGPQGSKKSTSLAVLGQAWHFETSEGMDNKDFFQQFEGKAIVEFSEGETLSRTEVKRMKAIITTQVDRYRPSYGRFSMDFPRRCVFAMTTNAEEYLKDETGNRRWLPVKVYKTEADVAWLKENREQLFAEAFYRLVTKCETTWEFPKAETIAAQNARLIHDPNSDVIEEWYVKLTNAERMSGITIHQAYNGALNGNFAGKVTRGDEMAIASVLRDHLRLEKVQNMVGGIRATRWYEPNSMPGTPDAVAFEQSQKGQPQIALSLDDF